MKKIGIVLLSLIFGLSLFVGQSFARGEKEHGTSGSTGQQSGVTGQQSGSQFGSMDQSEMQSQAGQINRAGEIIGKTVRNQQGEDLGELKDVVFDNQGNISYIVLSKGGMLGMGGDLTPIPWQAANASVQEDSLVLGMDKQRIDDAPSFKEDEWNNFTERQFQQEVRGYYGEGQDRESGFGQDVLEQENWREQEGSGVRNRP